MPLDVRIASSRPTCAPDRVALRRCGGRRRTIPGTHISRLQAVRSRARPARSSFRARRGCSTSWMAAGRVVLPSGASGCPLTATLLTRSLLRTPCRHRRAARSALDRRRPLTVPPPSEARSCRFAVVAAAGGPAAGGSAQDFGAPHSRCLSRFAGDRAHSRSGSGCARGRPCR